MTLGRVGCGEPSRFLLFSFWRPRLRAAGRTDDSSSENTQATTQAEAASGFDETLAALEGLSGDERRAKLVELAQAEGNLSFYTAMSPSVVDEVVSAFEDTFDIDVALYRATSETVLQRLLEEAKADFHGADAVESSGLEMVNLANEGVLVPYDSPSIENVVPQAVADGYTASRFNTFVVSWNTDLVPKGEEPASWEELADPKWKGRIAIEAGDVDWYKALWEYWVANGKTEEEADTLFEGIAANSVIVKGHTVMAELMAAGEFDVGVNYLHIVKNVAAEGAPLAWEPAVQPVFPRANGVGLVQRRRASRGGDALLRLAARGGPGRARRGQHDTRARRSRRDGRRRAGCGRPSRASPRTRRRGPTGGTSCCSSAKSLPRDRAHAWFPAGEAKP